MGLDARGIIAAVQIVMYAPVLILAGVLVLRNGFSRNAGWIFLVTISLFRIVGGVTHVLSENDPTNKTERIIYSTMESAGLSQLLMATLGFLRTVTQYSLEDNTLATTGLKLVGLVGTIGLALTVSGGVSAGNATSQSSLDNATTQRHIGVILFVAMYLGTVGLTVVCWQRRARILKYRRQLFNGVIATLPFIGVRVLYGLLGGFAPSPLSIVDGKQVPSVPSNDGLGKFTTSSSDWGIYLVMSVLMEYAAVLIYAVVGVRTPLSKDVPDYGKTETSSESYMLYSK